MVSKPALEDSSAGDTNTDQNQNQSQNPNANQSGNSSNSINLDPTQPNSPYFIGSNDNTGALLVTHTLDANNYHSRARSMKRTLRIKNRLGFIDGCLTEPANPNNLLMEYWLRCNDIVITWIQNTMAVDIKCSTTYAETAHQLWIELEQRFAQQNAPRIFEIKQAISMLLQNQDPISVYFSKFKTLLDKLMNYEAVPNYNCGGLKTVIQNQQRDWVMKFLMGLSDSYKGIKAQILLIKPFPSLNEVYSIIQQEEKRREISTEGYLHESMTLLAKGNFKEKGRQNTYSQKKDRYYCTFCKIGGHSLDRCFKANPDRPICAHCQIPGHQVDKCYKVHGYLPGHKFSGKEKASANQAMASLSPAQGVGNSKSRCSCFIKWTVD
ncbi:uncharacterized protein LOC111387759 [Olea europaea var. sylvestris]|uniref:uncharacterized protein LOC111387759 n=1 Tax=Olea europaea var. sylvestris TaxID=158386 RepID=UPI000C1CFAD7|nr:uncharacterized protein LOC111387759 [Olea europaea var. sylvestris]